MTKRSVTIALVFAATLAFSATALATPKTIPGRQADVSKALAGLKISVKNKRFVTNKRGRRDLVLYSSTSMPQVAAEFKRAYRQDLKLAEGYQVVGWAFMPFKNSYSATLRKGDERLVAEVFADGRGSAISIWGYVRNPRKDARTPRRALPPAKPTVNR